MKNGESEEYRLVIEGNALYEVDMECVRCRESRRKAAEEECKKARQKKNSGKNPEKLLFPPGLHRIFHGYL